MTDSGYGSYQDSRLQPPDEAEMTPTDCMEECVHAEACRAQLERLRGYDVNEDAAYWMDTLATDLGCGEDCDEYDDGTWMQRRCRERIDALRSECARLLGIVRMAESEGDVCYVNHEFTERLRSLGVEVK